MTLQELKTYAEDMSNRYPELNDQIRDLYFLAEMEVEDGESEDHECELAYSDIEQLVEEFVAQ